jgi:hypothetical protein
MEGPESAVFANLGALVALGAFAPLLVGVRFRRHPDLFGEMRDDAPGNVLSPVREAPIEFEGFEQNGETESSAAHLVAEEFTLIWRERPVVNKFIRVPVLLHRREAALRFPLSEEPFESGFKITFGQYGVNRSALQFFGQGQDGCDPGFDGRDLFCQTIHLLKL